MPRPLPFARATLLSLALLGVAGCAAELTSRQAHRLVDAGAQLVDVRSAEAFAEVHLPGAINAPVELLKQQVSSLPRDRDLVVYCHTGIRAGIAAKILRDAGFTRVHNLSTMGRWRDDPVRSATPFD